MVWEPSKAAGERGGLVRVKDGEHGGCQRRDMQGNGLSGKATGSNIK